MGVFAEDLRWVFRRQVVLGGLAGISVLWAVLIWGIAASEYPFDRALLEVLPAGGYFLTGCCFGVGAVVGRGGAVDLRRPAVAWGSKLLTGTVAALAVTWPVLLGTVMFGRGLLGDGGDTSVPSPDVYYWGEVLAWLLWIPVMTVFAAWLGVVAGLLLKGRGRSGTKVGS